MSPPCIRNQARPSPASLQGGGNKGENDVRLCFQSAASSRRHCCCLHNRERDATDRVATRFLVELHLMGSQTITHKSAVSLQSHLQWTGLRTRRFEEDSFRCSFSNDSASSTMLDAGGRRGPERRLRGRMNALVEFLTMEQAICPTP